MRATKLLVGTVLVAGATALLPAGPASAAEPYDGMGARLVCFSPDGTTASYDPETTNPNSGPADTDSCLLVQVEGRIGTKTRPFDSTAGAGWIDAQPDSQVGRVQIDKVVLGTQYGVLTTSGAKNSGTTSPAQVELQGPGRLWGRYCTTKYHVAVYWSARLKNGQLKTGKLLGPWYTAPTCP